MLTHAIYILFLFLLGACVGSFLNVVVWRLPRGLSLIRPRSSCPNCGHLLSWNDNIPVVGWMMLGGKCRYCREPISARYPIVEAIMGAIFVFYYVAWFIFQHGPCAAQPTMIPDQLGFLHARPLNINDDWPMYGLYMFLLAALFAGSLIDIETFTIPASIFWWAAGAGIVMHAIFDEPRVPGALNLSAVPAALSAGAAIGLLVSIALLHFKLIPLSFAEGGPLLDVDKAKLRLEQQQAQSSRRESGAIEYETPPDAALPPEFTRAQIRAEMAKEIVFLLPPLTLGAACAMAMSLAPAAQDYWNQHWASGWLSGALGSILGALVGAFIIWFTRILGSIAFGREAMGLGDVHLMFGVGAVVGAGGATIAFFLAPFFGMAIAIYRWLSGKGREVPYGPFLGLGTAAVMLFYCPIAAYLRPGLQGVASMVHDLVVRH